MFTNQVACHTRLAVILAAGESRRTRPLTLHRPKPLISLNGQPLLAHILDELVGLVERVILVVGYRAEDIQACFGDTYRGIDLEYARQKQVNGTASALLAVADRVDAPFFLLYGDNLISREDLLAVCRERYALAGIPVDDPRSFGILEVVEGSVQRILEKPETVAAGALGNPGIYHFDAQVFPLLQHIRPSPRGEYELTDLIEVLAQADRVGYSRCAGHWIPVGTPWDALVASLFLLERAARQPSVRHPAASVPETCELQGDVRLGRARLGAGCRVFGPAYIGDDVVIGDNCVVRHSVLDAGTVLGDHCVVEYSMLGSAVSLAAGCEVAYSVLDDAAQLGAQVHMPAQLFDGVMPTAQTVGLLDRAVLCRRGGVVGPAVSVPAGTRVEPGTVLSPQ